MPAEYVPITQKDMEEFLFAKGFEPLALPNVKELVYALSRKRGDNHFRIRVYSSIVAGVARKVGGDAIRVEVWWRGEKPADTPGAPPLVTPPYRLGGDRRVHRVKGWRDNLLARLKRWDEGLGEPCPLCGAPTVLREPGKASTWKAFFGCCRFRDGCKGTLKANG